MVMEKKSAERETEYKASVDDKGNVVLKKKEKIKKGKQSRAAGGQFELRVRKDLEEKGWIVDKWSNNIDLEFGKIIPCKRVFKRFGVGKGVMTIGTGFPDFIAFHKMTEERYNLIGVEVKMNGNLSKEEKLKCKFLLEEGVFSEILVAEKEKIKNRVHIKYIDVKEILERMRGQ